MIIKNEQLKKVLAIALVTAAIIIEGKQYAFAQFQPVLFSVNNSWRTQANPPVGAIGIGVFPNGTNLPSALTINTNLLPAGSQTGEVFRTDAPVGTTAWRMFSANVAANQKFSIVNPAGSNNVNLAVVQNGSMNFFTNTTGTLKMRISHDALDRPRIGIGGAAGFNPPLTYLHLGDVNAVFGYRTWMDVGTLYAQGTDNMYTGLKNDPANPAGDKNDAIINWGNNPIDPNFPQNTDRLRFIFTSILGGGIPKASTFDGLEVARMTAAFDNTTNNVFSRMGVGDFFTPNLDPQNALEIRANTDAAGNIIDPSPSGLRFTHLTSAFIPTVTTNEYLSVDAAGNVILVNDGGGGIGTCGASALTAHGDIPLGGNNFYFENGHTPTAGINNVGIGMPCGSPLAAKLDVVNAENNFGGHFTSNFTTGANYGIFSEANGSGLNIGLLGFAQGNGSSGQSFGVQGQARGSLVNYGGNFSATLNIGGATINYGVIGNASSAATNIGVQGEATAGGTNRAGKFVGDLEYTNSLIGSDIKLKENIQDIPNATNTLMQLQPRTFTFKTNDFPSMNLPAGTRFGLIAQELETVLSELVKPSFQPATVDSAGNVIYQAVEYESSDYIALIPILIQGFKEQQAQINSLLNAKSTNPQINQFTSLPSTDAELASENSILWQNFPNPFGDGTIIRYFVINKSASASMIFYDEFGNQVKTVELPHKGQNAELNLSTSNLAAGIYSYSLVVDGKITDTKKMIKSK